MNLTRLSVRVRVRVTLRVRVRLRVGLRVRLGGGRISSSSHRHGVRLTATYGPHDSDKGRAKVATWQRQLWVRGAVGADPNPNPNPNTNAKLNPNLSLSLNSP